MKPLSSRKRQIRYLPKFLQSHLKEIELTSVSAFKDFYFNYGCDCRDCNDVAFRLGLKEPLSSRKRQIRYLPKFLQSHLKAIELTSVSAFKDFYFNYGCDCRDCNDVAFRLGLKAVSI